MMGKRRRRISTRQVSDVKRRKTSMQGAPDCQTETYVSAALPSIEDGDNTICQQTWLPVETVPPLPEDGSASKLQNVAVEFQQIDGVVDTDSVGLLEQESTNSFSVISWTPSTDEPGDEAQSVRDDVIHKQLDHCGTSATDLSSSEASCFASRVWVENDDIDVPDLTAGSDLALFNQGPVICGSEVSDEPVLIEDEGNYIKTELHTITIPSTTDTCIASVVNNDVTAIAQPTEQLQSEVETLNSQITAESGVSIVALNESSGNSQITAESGVSIVALNESNGWLGQLQGLADSAPVLLLSQNAENGTYEASVIFSPCLKTRPAQKAAQELVAVQELVKVDSENVAQTEAEQTQSLAVADCIQGQPSVVVQEPEQGQALENTDSGEDLQIEETLAEPEPDVTDRGHICKVPGCGRAFSSAGYVRHHHQAVHSTRKALVCPFEGCGRTFVWPNHLKYHQLTHVGARLFPCCVHGCGQSFYTAQRLEVHMMIHTGARPFPCPEASCTQSFTTAGNLRNHRRVHSGERPYQCPVAGCSRRFAEYSSLKKHGFVHSGAKPHSCHICGRQFTQSGSRNVHIRKHHAAEQQAKQDLSRTEAGTVTGMGQVVIDGDQIRILPYQEGTIGESSCSTVSPDTPVTETLNTTEHMVIVTEDGSIHLQQQPTGYHANVQVDPGTSAVASCYNTEDVQHGEDSMIYNAELILQTETVPEEIT